jgi:hypothetical protein
LIAFKFNGSGALSRAFEKPPAGERGVDMTGLVSRGLVVHIGFGIGRTMLGGGGWRACGGFDDESC